MKRVLLLVIEKNLEAYIQELLSELNVACIIVHDIEEAKNKYVQNTFDLIISQVEAPEFLNWIQTHHNIQPVLALTLQEIYSTLDYLKQLTTSKYVIGQKSSDLLAARKYVKDGIKKIITQDYFGLEKYIQPALPVKEWLLTSSKQRAQVIDEIEAQFKTLSVRSSLLDQCRVVAEEMLMNAIYDAPADEQGRALFNHLSRNQEVILKNEQSIKLRIAHDEDFVAISVQDPFGALTKDIIFSYLNACYIGDSTEHENKGGAGKGLHQIIENSDIVVFNILPKKQTEVICFIALGSKRETAKLFPGFQFFMI